VWQTSTVAKEAEVPTWILVVGGAGIVLGLATYGYKIMRVLGVKMTKLTNSRGGCLVRGGELWVGRWWVGGCEVVALR